MSRRQILREPLQQFLPILRTPFSALLELHDASPDFPIRRGHEAVRRTDDGTMGFLQQRADAGEQGWVVGHGFCFGSVVGWIVRHVELGGDSIDVEEFVTVEQELAGIGEAVALEVGGKFRALIMARSAEEDELERCLRLRLRRGGFR